MIINTLSRHAKPIAWFLYFSFYGQLVAGAMEIRKEEDRLPWVHYSSLAGGRMKHLAPLPGIGGFTSEDFGYRASPKQLGYDKAIKKTFGGGPSQPEMQAFQSVNANNMVDLFSGDFSYNIPLMDVGGYPVNISYRSGISMDQEASWVGLGWNVNPGTISRNLRGLPDDFNGNDSVTKITSIKEDKTVGITGGGGGDLEIVGFPVSIGLGANLGIFHNTYKGWGLESGLNASINSGSGATGPLTGGLGLSVKNNSQDGLTLTPSLSINLEQKNADESASCSGSFSTSLPYNSRTGLKGLELSIGERQSKTDLDNQHSYSTEGSIGGEIAFASPAITPTITLPITSRQFSFTAKLGLAEYVAHPSFYISGYVSRQTIDRPDTILSLPAYGYLHYQDAVNNPSALLDFNREKELVYRETPPMPHIAIPVYTYDAFSISGEGTGGMFRAYRGDIGFMHDHFMRTKDASDKLSVDVGVSDLVHAGADLNVTRAFTQSGAWEDQNSMRNVINFKQDSAMFEAAYFRNPGEKSINSKKFYDAIGGDDVVAVRLYQPGIVSGSVIEATNYLTHYRSAAAVGDSLLTKQNSFKTERDKRTQVISYLTAKEADVAGLSRYIENYTLNQFSLANCQDASESLPDQGTGLVGEYYSNPFLKGAPYYTKTNDTIDHNWGTGTPVVPTKGGSVPFPRDTFSIRWTGRIKAPVSGTYIFTTISDDGARAWLNDVEIANQWAVHQDFVSKDTLNLVAGEFYDLKLEYYENYGNAKVGLSWSYPGQSSSVTIARKYLFPPAADSFKINSYLIKEKRLNSFRKENHISEIDVLNNDGRRYVYGIPVYNLRQKEATFAVDGQHRGSTNTGLVGYTGNIENTAANNQQGKDWYFSAEEMPAYAHSFLLTGIVSPDYVDLTGDGISDDDPGDAVKFDYSKVCGINNPYRWRAPYADTSASGVSLASYNEGMKTESRDDKGNYVYGEKELWYLHAIESKTMIATFLVENRNDLFAIDENGHKYADSSGKRLKEIDLYSKADFIKNGTAATPVKTVHFEYSYELCRGVNRPLTDSGKLTLKRIWFTYNGNDKGKQNPYVFNYNSLNPSYNIKSYDRWGNYKDPLQNPGSTATNLINNSEYPYSLQDSSLAAKNAAAWSLDSVYLPSGGAIKVKFESDDYAYVQNLRAMNLMKLAGLGPDSNMSHSSNNLYVHNAFFENLYVYVKVPSAVSNKTDIYQKYLTGVSKLYFRLFVRMPDDQYGSGSEYISCYADLDQGNSYGRVNNNTIWIRIKGITLAGDGPGPYSPLAKAAIQFLRLNLPSKAYAGSEPGDDLDLASAVKMVFAELSNVATAFQSFDITARQAGWCTTIDTSRSFIRLDNPCYKKIGGGYRVKRITIYDKWDKMNPGARAAMYGQDYTYTTQQQINGKTTTISSGVASYEPGIGGEENPFRQPIEYVESVSPLGPTTLGYSEEPLGESVFPSAGVGYSKVRVRTINYKNRKSANGYEETTFYTAYDFPTFTDRSLLDNDTKKRYKPALANFLKINAQDYLTLSQGFKVELNDMHGKLRTQAYYPETDPNNYTSYTENIYKVVDQGADQKKLSNTVCAMHPDGTIDTTALIGKDAELMADMREQESITNGYNISPNTDMFAVPWLPPLFILPDMINLGQREQNQFRSVAVLKVIQRYGILDSVIHIDKGSKVSTKDLLYDSETGDVLLTRTQNEFNDPVYSFSYPSHWAYDGMGLAYKNIDLTLQHIYIKEGKLIKGSPAADSILFSSGDEILVGGKQQTGTPVGCTAPFASFPDYIKIWAVDSSVLNGGAKCFYFIDQYGRPYNGNDITLKIIRSGRRNMNSMVGSVTTLQNPLVRDSATHQFKLLLNTGSGVVNAASAEFRQYWKVEDIHTQRRDTAITCTSSSCNDTIPATFQDTTISTCFSPARNSLYGDDGAYIYSSTHASSGIHFSDPTGGFWENQGHTLSGSRLNRCGIWPCGFCPAGECNPGGTWIGFTQSVYIPASDTMFIGLGGDNQVRVIVDGDTIQVLQGAGDPGDVLPFEKWYVYPKFLGVGYHDFKIEGWNVDDFSNASFGAEIYYLPRSVLTSTDSVTIRDNTLFSTASVAAINQNYPAGYSCPGGYTLDSTGGTHRCIRYDSCSHCDTIITASCKSVVTDTTFNPYIVGVLGDWRGTRNYTYFGPRTEIDPSAATNIRRNGTFASFAPFWAFGSNKVLVPQYDTTRWVWNSENTLFNRKGLEIENRDPLGRYNSIQYGYNLTLPVAVTQNGRFRESAFEGFEDYGFVSQVCDTACPGARHIDFTPYLSKITTAQKHSGKSSLQLNAGESAGLSFSLIGLDTAQANISFATLNDTCPGAGTVLKKITIPTSILLPTFSPFKGKQMLVSAWVKEQQSCTCTSYANNDMKVVFTGGSGGTQTITFHPTGNIIEGWQRYEGMFTIPSDATGIAVDMEATGSTTVYFDDLRIQPFNANMKSFVYNPVNLRLMAELDENNHATFYEYDDDGTLIRVKKETERGIQTIKETRSALLKQ
jgi:hypothetical protein